MRKTTKRIFWGLLWALAGIMLLLSNYGVIAYKLSLSRDWPAVFVLIGLSNLIDSLTNHQ